MPRVPKESLKRKLKIKKKNKDAENTKGVAKKKSSSSY